MTVRALVFLHSFRFLFCDSNTAAVEPQVASITRNFKGIIGTSLGMHSCGGGKKMSAVGDFFLFHIAGDKLTILVFIVSAIKGRHMPTEQAAAQAHFYRVTERGKRGGGEEEAGIVCFFVFF